MGLFKKAVNTDMPDLTAIAEFLVEDFRFSRSFCSALNKLFAEEKKRYESAYNFHRKKVDELMEKLHLQLVIFDGKEYDDGLPITPLNIDEFGKSDRLVIEQTIEPTVLGEDGKVLKRGTVILVVMSDLHKNK